MDKLYSHRTRLGEKVNERSAELNMTGSLSITVEL